MGREWDQVCAVMLILCSRKLFVSMRGGGTASLANLTNGKSRRSSTDCDAMLGRSESRRQRNHESHGSHEWEESAGAAGTASLGWVDGGVSA